ncbi:CDP-alcohol phosphatidyltransferase family protein [Candidatus Woesearchaeota archaeon]|nr:CDP-alcohol phosphatidyltransferase family protein [Candidatus Woesearchaeota archaeon]
MATLMEQWVEKFRVYRSQKLPWLGTFFLRCHITANVMTIFSFLAGLGTVYFLFQNHLYFILFGLLHLILDGIDGVIARASAASTFGKYLDHASDQLIGVLLILKIAVVTQDYFVYIIAGLIFLGQLFYALSRFTAPAHFPRSIILIVLVFQQVTLAFLVAGVIGVYTLALQLRWVLRRKSL